MNISIRRSSQWGVIVVVVISLFCGRTASCEDRVKPTAVFSGLPDWVCAAQFAPREPILAIGTYEEVRLYSTETRKEIAKLPSKTGFIRSLCFSPDGVWLATGGYHFVEVWDVAMRKRLLTRKLHKGYVNELAFSPQGDLLATGGDDHLVRLWQVAAPAPPDPAQSDNGFTNLLSAEPIATLSEHTFPVLGLAFSPKGDLLCTGAGEETQAAKAGETLLWSVPEGKLLHKFTPHTKATTKVAFSPNGLQLVSASIDEQVDVYDVESRNALGFFPGHSRAVNSVIWWSSHEPSPAGATGMPPFTAEQIAQLTNHVLISGSGGRNKGMNDVRLWNPEDGSEFGVIDHHAAKVTRVALSPNGRWLVTTSYDKTAALWDLRPLLLKAVETLAKETAQPAKPVVPE